MSKSREKKELKKKSLTDEYIKNYKNKKDEINKISFAAGNFEFTFEPNNIVLIKSDVISKMITCTYQTIGIYNQQNEMWYWSWALPFISSEEYNNLDKIRNYPNVLFNKQNYNSLDIEKYSFYCSTNSFLASKINIDELLMMSLYILDGIWIYNHTITTNKTKFVKFIIITKINKL